MTQPGMRQRSRQAALQVLYAVDVAGGDPGPGAEEAFESVAGHFELPEGARAYAKELVVGVLAGLSELDGHIASVARNWRVERMAAVDRNVLRLAAYELLGGSLPTEIVIDEAVELARRFGADRSPGFVNGILDALARQPEEPAP